MQDVYPSYRITLYITRERKIYPITLLWDIMPGATDTSTAATLGVIVLNPTPEWQIRSQDQIKFEVNTLPDL